MSVSKVSFDNNPLIDLTEDTAVEANVTQGKYFHKADGSRVQGSLNLVPMSNEITIKQLQENGDFHSTSTSKDGWGFNNCTALIANNSITITCTSANTYSGFRMCFSPREQNILGDKVYGRLLAKSDTAYNTCRMAINARSHGWTVFENKAITPSSDFSLFDGIATVTNEPTAGVGIAADIYFPFSKSIIGSKITIKDVMLFNLTKIFGAGNEPPLGLCRQLFAHYIPDSLGAGQIEYRID